MQSNSFLSGVYAALGQGASHLLADAESVAALHDALETNGYHDPSLTLASKDLIADFRRGDYFHSPAHQTTLALYLQGVPGIFWKEKAGSPTMRWEPLDHLAQRALAGEKQVLPNIEKVLNAGFVAEMSLTMEHAVFHKIIKTDQRSNAFAVLEKLEREFDAFWQNPKEVSLQNKYDRVLTYVHEARSRGLVLDVDDETSLDSVFNLVQVHEFLHHKAALMKPYLKGPFPSLLTDFILGRSNSVAMAGCCQPMAVLAIHFGQRIDTPLIPYFLEGHISLFVPVEGGFLYEPTRRGGEAFYPPDQPVLDLLAPKKNALVSTAELVLFHPIACRRNLKLARILTDFFPDQYDTWHVLADCLDSFDRPTRRQRMERNNAIERGLEIFPESVVLLLIKINLLLEKGPGAEAETLLEKIWGIIQRRHEREKSGSVQAAVSAPNLLWYFHLLKIVSEHKKQDWSEKSGRYYDLFWMLNPQSREGQQVAQEIIIGALHESGRLFHLGRYEEAALVLEDVLKVQVTDLLLWNLVLVYWQGGDNGSVRNFLLRGLAEYPDFFREKLQPFIQSVHLNGEQRRWTAILSDIGLIL